MKGEITDLEATLPEIPRPPRLWSDDVTPEHLGTMMGENGERMAILSDEAGIFEQMGGRYSNGVPNLDLFLQGHAGSPVRVDRGSRPPVCLQRPALTIGISPQPDVLRGLTEKPSFRGRGLLARFLYALPASNLGQRTGETRPLSGDLKLRWEGRLTAMLNAEPATDRNGEPCPHTLKLSPEALAAHALAVFDLMGADPALDGARVVLGWIRREGRASFTFRDCHNTHQSRFKRAADLEPVIGVLSERHYIRPLVAQEKPGRGRPSKAYDVNPAVQAGRWATDGDGVEGGP